MSGYYKMSICLLGLVAVHAAQAETLIHLKDAKAEGCKVVCTGSGTIGLDGKPTATGSCTLQCDLSNVSDAGEVVQIIDSQ